MIALSGFSVPSLKPSRVQPAVQRARVLPQLRALVVRVLQLADRRRGGRDDRRRQAGGEDIGAAGQADRLELRMVRHAEAADRADRLGEGADDEVDVALAALLLVHAAAVGAVEAHRMRFVAQHHRAVLLGDRDHFLERRDVAEHRIDALEHDQLARLPWAGGRGACRDPRRRCGGSGRSRHCPACSRRRSRRGCRRRG